jgi:hypothetical protein
MCVAHLSRRFRFMRYDKYGGSERAESPLGGVEMPA